MLLVLSYSIFHFLLSVASDCDLREKSVKRILIESSKVRHTEYMGHLDFRHICIYESAKGTNAATSPRHAREVSGKENW